MGNRELAGRIVDKFKRRIDDDVDEIKACIESGDADSSASLAHRPKGAAANLSAESLHEAAARLETIGRAAKYLSKFKTVFSNMGVFL